MVRTSARFPPPLRRGQQCNKWFKGQVQISTGFHPLYVGASNATKDYIRSLGGHPSFHPLYVGASNATLYCRLLTGRSFSFHPLYVGASNATYAFVTYRIATI